MNPQFISLISSRFLSFRNQRHVSNNETEFPWLFFGENYVRLLECEGILGKQNRLSISTQLRDTAWNLRIPYLEWLDQITEHHKDDPAWWYSMVAEKNTTSSDFFQNLCYLSIVTDLYREGRLPNTIVIDSLPLLLALNRHLKKLGCDVKVFGGTLLQRGIFLVTEWTRFLASWVYKLTIILRRLHAARVTRHLASDLSPDLGRPRALMFFWVNDADMGKNGVLRNAYFTQLPEFLQSSGYDVVNIARPQKTQQSLHSVFSWLRKQGNVLIPEDFMTWRDIFIGARLLLRMYRIPKQVDDFLGIDVRDLLMKERIRQASNVMFIQFLAYGSMIAQLKVRGFRIDAYLFPFENMALEKPIVVALHEHYPQVRSIGFQHTTVTPFMLKFSAWTSCFTSGNNYLPDEIVCNGFGYRKGLELSGFPSDRLTIGPALRYLYLWREAQKHAEKSIEPSLVLVTLPLSFPLAIEILHKALELSQGGAIPIAIKPHPYNDREKLLATLGMKDLPTGLQWCEGPMSEWLSKAVCLVSLGSGTLVEAVCSHVPIVILGMENGLEFNPLGWWEDQEPMFRVVGSLIEARSKISMWIEMSEELRLKIVMDAAQFIRSQFQPWDEREMTKLVNRWLEPHEH